MAFERNTIDVQSVAVEEKGLINDGASDEAIATITGSYPNAADTYLCNTESDMLIYPYSGLGEVVLRSPKKKRRFSINAAKNQSPIMIEKGEGYYYSVQLGGELAVRLVCTPPWNEDQYRTITIED